MISFIHKKWKDMKEKDLSQTGVILKSMKHFNGFNCFF